MKKILNLVVVGIFVLALSGFVMAQNQAGIHEPGTGLDNPELMAATTGAGMAAGEGLAVRAMAGNYVGEAGQQIQLREQTNNQMRLEVGGVGVDCDCNLTQERIQNNTRLYVGLTNGKNAEVKIMPDVASQTALNRLKLKNCNESLNCSIELKEVGVGENVELAYELKTQRQSKVLGLFGAKMQVQTQVNAETGEVIRTKKPWWAFLAAEPQEE